jgi:Hemerythrin HHE cation binding domain
MDVTQLTTDTTPCGSPLPELEIPLINTMVACLASEHRRLDQHILSLALAATRLASDGEPLAAGQAAFEIWDEVRAYLFPHLQIEDSLVFSWGADHHAISKTLLEALKMERREMGRVVADVAARSGEDRAARGAMDHSSLAQTLLALAQILDRHVGRFDSTVLPSIRRALFREDKSSVPALKA